MLTIDPPAQLDHLRHDGLGGKIDVAEIDGDRPVELLRRHVGEGLALVIGGVC